MRTSLVTPPVVALVILLLVPMFRCAPEDSETRSRAGKAATPGAPLSENQRKLEEVERRIDQLGAADMREGQQRLAELKERIQQQTGVIAEVEAQLGAQQATAAAEQRLREFQASQTSAVLQQRIGDLDRQIQAQEQIVRERQLAITQTFVPDNTDLAVQLQRSLQQAEERLAALRSDYVSLLQGQTASIQTSVTAREQELRSQQAGQIDLSLARSVAQSQIQELEQEHQRVSEDLSRKNKELESLREERRQLLLNESLQKLSAPSPSAVESALGRPGQASESESRRSP